ncbi:MAG: DEAD/DEAH box helicase family protein [Clostridia bacterium]|nr:DEAD/DEAH box helicase family protein [Clostridia bacterium]
MEWFTYEKEEDDGLTEISLDWGDFDEVKVSEKTDNLADGLVSCLNTLGRVDVPYIATACDKTPQEVVEGLRGSIYLNPEKWEGDVRNGWETADGYLSGNLRRKWRFAKSAAERFPELFSSNVEALERLLPQSALGEEIYITLGSPWVPTDVIDDFIEHLLGPYVSNINEKFRPGYLVVRDELTGGWEIPAKSRYAYGQYAVRATSAYGTSRMNALEIMEYTLNMKTVVVRDTVVVRAATYTQKPKTASVINREETVLAVEKQDLMIKEFQSWVWQDEKRANRLREIFEERFGFVRARQFDGSFLTFPTMDENAFLYPYQKNAVARILFSPNVLLAHEVGCGKTYIMVAAGMELRRMGVSKKNMYVVPNNLISQWADIFHELYPQAKVIQITSKDFTPKRREATLLAMRDVDVDAILIAYSCFDRIPVSLKTKLEDAEEELKKLDEKIKDGSNKFSSTLVARKNKLAKDVQSLRAKLQDEEKTVFFEDLGVQTLFVDEAHNYKNVDVNTKIENVQGLGNRDGSDKCRNMLYKVRCVQKQNGGRGVVFATGTPITNSIIDAFVMQKYLQNGELTLLDLHNFDSWVGMFAEKTTEFEIDVDTNSYRLATRFSKFHNLTELTMLLSSIADFYRADGATGLPQLDGYTDCLVDKTVEFSQYLDDISRRADQVRSGQVSRDEDNMLKITTDGRKAALDLRLVEPNAPFSYAYKVVRCAENVFDLYVKTLGKKSTQLVFCDTSTPKGGFNVYDELRRLLIEMGVPHDKIAYIHDAQSESRREELFEAVRTGQVRVLIGSTFKLGMGVNVQDKLIAVHHLDVPWRPSDMVQREGRILRQGNENKKVYIYRYVTDGSFDAYSWQLLESKQRFISQLLSGSLTEKEAEDVDSIVLDYAEVKALAIGNPLIKKRVETANELARLLTLHRKAVYIREQLEAELAEIPERLERQRKLYSACLQDVDDYKRLRREYTLEERTALSSAVMEAIAGYDFTEGVEKTIGEYQGFSVVLPSYLIRQKPHVWLKRNGKYKVDIGESVFGVIARLDNALETMDKQLQVYKDNVQSLILSKEEIRQELEKNNSYADEITACKSELEEIDKQLGVKKK